eukprot:TRINITY_DN35668_c0_g1_i1.p1 TRINITY_DN35668_c0_g1~~TRINITY_DN35668_c0_g1_i1.p1  ORF type:complete len:290 (-),score=40.67 TRINITY_DN35668_c0_g1_i1:310-1095(-)
MAAAAKLKGNDAYKARSYDSAIAHYTTAISADPSDHTLWSNRSAAYAARDPPLFDKSLTDANECVKLQPQWPKGYFRKGLAHLKLQQYEQAIEALSKALSLTGATGDASIQELLTQARQLMKDAYGSKVGDQVTDPAEAKRLGNALFKDSNYTEAAEFYSRAIQLAEQQGKRDGELAVYYINRAACHSQTHSYKNVVADCTTALEVDPQCVKAHLRRAIAYEGLEKWKDAAADYKEVQRLAPGTATASAGYTRCIKYAQSA